jgi:transcriptional regulator with XRE-family HTH domain
MEIENQLDHVVMRIKGIRLEKRLSQMEVSLRSGLSQGFITDIELGKKQPSVLTLLRIADALGVNPADFFPTPIAKTPADREAIKQRIRELLECL